MRAFSSFDRPEGIGPAGTKTAGRWPKESAAITSPGTILSQTPRKTAASNMLWERPTAAASAMTSRENSDSRSEEHTSEIQSLMRISYAVFRLKKKNNTTVSVHCRRHCVQPEAKGSSAERDCVPTP